MELRIAALGIGAALLATGALAADKPSFKNLDEKTKAKSDGEKHGR